MRIKCAWALTSLRRRRGGVLGGTAMTAGLARPRSAAQRAQGKRKRSLRLPCPAYESSCPRTPDRPCAPLGGASALAAPRRRHSLRRDSMSIVSPRSAAIRTLRTARVVSTAQTPSWCVAPEPKRVSGGQVRQQGDDVQQVHMAFGLSHPKNCSQTVKQRPLEHGRGRGGSFSGCAFGTRWGAASAAASCFAWPWVQSGWGLASAVARHFFPLLHTDQKKKSTLWRRCCSDTSPGSAYFRGWQTVGASRSGKGRVKIHRLLLTKRSIARVWSKVDLRSIGSRLAGSNPVCST